MKADDVNGQPVDGLDMAASSFAPRVVVVIPVFKHPGLLAEAVGSVLAQRASFEIAVVIVNDGCPFPETEEIGQAYALAGENVFYVRKPNGGLSSARNFGIDFAARTFPSFEAIYLLDADNRITTSALQAAIEKSLCRYSELRESTNLLSSICSANSLSTFFKRFRSFFSSSFGFPILGLGFFGLP